MGNVSKSEMFQTVLSRLAVTGKADAQGNYTALCPFHDDREHPNLRIHPDKGYYCFACQAKGSIRDLAKHLRVINNPLVEKITKKRVKSNAEAEVLLRERGLTDDTISHFGIEPDLEKQAWRYPVAYQGKVMATRYKAFPNRLGIKYWWAEKGVTFPVYSLDDVSGEMEVWLVAGEPDLWICYQVGVKAITFPFGEVTVPKGAVELLKEAGIEKLNIIYDLDDAGKKGAPRVAQSLRDNGFDASIRELPSYLGHKGDVNDLFLSVGKDREKFVMTIAGLPEAPIEVESGTATRGKGKRREEPIYLARFNGLMDIVDCGGDLAYLVKGQTGPQVISSVEIDGTTYLPPPRDQLPYLIPRFEAVEQAYREDGQDTLFRDLIEYHKRFSQLPGEGYYILLAAWDFSTYLLEALNYSGYIYLYAVPERGKTKTGQAMIYVAYRGIHQENLREADLFRASEDLNATLFIDVLNLWKKAQREGSEDILLQRYEKGAKIRRVIHPDRGSFRDSRYYSTYGATVIASNEAISQILESRSFPIDMPYAARNFPKPTPEAGLPYRERLVAWRARYLGTELPAPKQLAQGRLNDISSPLWQIISLVSPSHLNDYERLIAEFNQKRRRERASSVEGEVVRALLELEGEVEEGKLPVSKVTDEVNERRGDAHKLSSIYVGKVLRRLNVEQAPTHGRERSYIYNAELVRQLACEHGLADICAHSAYLSEASQLSHQMRQIPIHQDRKDEKDSCAEGISLPKDQPKASVEDARLRVLALGEQLGWPSGIGLGPGKSIVAGEQGWRRFAVTASLEELERALEGVQCN